MTNEQAINLITRISYSQHDAEKREALEMAVRALEGDGDLISRQAVMKEFSDFVRESNNSDFAPTPTWNDAVSLVGSIPSVQPVNYGSTKTDSSSQLKLNNDLISRKMAIEAFEPTHYKDWYTPTIIETLETLPSVRPEILACGNGELVEESGGLVQDLVKDCISRKMAIDVLDKHIDTFDAIDTNYLCGLRTAMSFLKELPSAQPERKKGKWIDNDKINFPQCSECGMWIDVMQQSGEMNFCPNCGADMRGESDED